MGIMGRRSVRPRCGTTPEPTQVIDCEQRAVKYAAEKISLSWFEAGQLNQHAEQVGELASPLRGPGVDVQVVEPAGSAAPGPALR